MPEKNFEVEKWKTELVKSFFGIKPGNEDKDSSEKLGFYEATVEGHSLRSSAGAPEKEEEENGGREYPAKSLETPEVSGTLGVNEAAVDRRSLRSSAGAPEEEEEESGGREFLAKSAKTQRASGALGVNGIRTGSHFKDDKQPGQYLR